MIIEHFKELVSYMNELCEEHMSASWVSSWEHYLWDAILSDGTFIRNPDDDALSRHLTDAELAKLRTLFKATLGWPAWKTSDPSDLRFVYALIERPEELEGTEHVDTVQLDLPKWELLHRAWLATPGGRWNKLWRNNIYKITGKTVEEIGEMRDHAVALYESMRATPLAHYQFAQGKCLLHVWKKDIRSDTLLAWLPKDVRDNVRISYGHGPTSILV